MSELRLEEREEMSSTEVWKKDNWGESNKSTKFQAVVHQVYSRAMEDMWGGEWMMGLKQ